MGSAGSSWVLDSRECFSVQEGGLSMQLASADFKHKHVTHLFFRWRNELSFSHRLALAFTFACLTGLAAQIRIPLPFTPVPVTGQVLAVLLSGIVLGGCYGGVSQLFYLGLGVVGLPWFSGGIGGLAVIAGPTGGYIIGFIPAALAIGWLTDKYVSAKRFHFQLLLMSVGVGIIYIFGAARIAILMNTGFSRTMQLAVIPFIPIDLIKSVLAAGVSAGVLSKSAISKVQSAPSDG